VAGIGVLIGTSVGIESIAANKADRPTLRWVLIIAALGGAAVAVLTDAINRHASLVENQQLQQRVDRLGSPIIDTDVTYQVPIPISDPRLAALRSGVIAAAKAQERHYEHLPQPEYQLPRLPLADILSRLPTAPSLTDASAFFLRSMDIEVDFYLPAFSGGPPDLQLSTDYLVPLPETVGRSLQVPRPFGERTPTTTPYVIWFCDCRQVDFAKPTPYVSAYAVPIKRSARSGRLISIFDLKGSTMIIHLRPDFLSAAFHPDMMKNVKLRLLTISVDGVNYHVNLARAAVGATQMFTYYELKIPANWNPQTMAIP